jgi:radical SAM superfamily enzyme YgiQ (UPF0313 family)
MKTCLHLLAMPMAYPMHPSSQLGYLHGYIEREFSGRAVVKSHSAFLHILHDVAGTAMVDFFQKYNLLGEEILFLVCCYHRARLNLGNAAGEKFDDLWQLYNTYGANDLNVSHQNIVPISKRQIALLNDALESYLASQFMPSLQADALNIVGFTATFCQVFGSIFAANYIRRHTNKDVLFVFGGSSFSLPEGTRTLERWGVDGLIVSGSGEIPLAEIVQAALEIDSSEDPLAAIDARNIVNVIRAGAPPKPIALEMSKSFMGTLPDPNYDEYFDTLRSLCSDEATYRYALSRFVSIPLEGSRGCFARCDFCHNPNITSEFRSLTGRRVAQRTIDVCQKYGTDDVTFVDSVCNTWAEEYADHLLSKNRRINAFMELRVHAPEAFWTKLALCGVTAMQLGVEAISEPLLQNMIKGTRVLQNLSATKYIAELELETPSNIIIHHPKSTVADVEETKRIITIAEHLPAYALSHYVVSYASPVYNELDDERKSKLLRGFDWVPAELREYSWPRHLSYTYLPEWIDPAVVAAWNDFQNWYIEHSHRVAARRPVFTVENGDDALIFTDTRFGQERRYALSGDAALIYEVCHAPSTVQRIAGESGRDPATVTNILDALVDRAMMVNIGERYLSLALRPREQLLRNLFSSARRPQQVSGSVVENSNRVV